MKNNTEQPTKITNDHIENCIKEIVYFTAMDGVIGTIAYNIPAELPFSDSLNLLTFCVIVLKNNFTVVGTSACVHPDNFDKKIGREIALENAKSKIWELEGYMLKSLLAQQEEK